MDESKKNLNKSVKPYRKKNSYKMTVTSGCKIENCEKCELVVSKDEENKDENGGTEEEKKFDVKIEGDKKRRIKSDNIENFNFKKSRVNLKNDKELNLSIIPSKKILLIDFKDKKNNSMKNSVRKNDFIKDEKSTTTNKIEQPIKKKSDVKYKCLKCNYGFILFQNSCYGKLFSYIFIFIFIFK